MANNEVRTRYWAINGYWKDDGETIDGYIVSSDNEPIGGCDVNDEIFFYFAREEELDEMVALGENTEADLVITHYEEITELYNVTQNGKD